MFEQIYERDQYCDNRTTFIYTDKLHVPQHLSKLRYYQTP